MNSTPLTRGYELSSTSRCVYVACLKNACDTHLRVDASRLLYVAPIAALAKPQPLNIFVEVQAQSRLRIVLLSASNCTAVCTRFELRCSLIHVAVMPPHRFLTKITSHPHARQPKHEPPAALKSVCNDSPAADKRPIYGGVELSST